MPCKWTFLLRGFANARAIITTPYHLRKRKFITFFQQALVIQQECLLPSQDKGPTLDPTEHWRHPKNFLFSVTVASSPDQKLQVIQLSSWAIAPYIGHEGQESSAKPRQGPSQAAWANLRGTPPRICPLQGSTSPWFASGTVAFLWRLGPCASQKGIK